jgi:hypothetical protein
MLLIFSNFIRDIESEIILLESTKLIALAMPMDWDR